MPTSPLYQLEIDRPRKLVMLTFLAMLAPEDAAWVGEELRAAVQSFGDDISQHVTLYDASAVPAVPTATIDQLRATFSNPRCARYGRARLPSW